MYRFSNGRSSTLSFVLRFIVLLLHYVSRAKATDRARRMVPASDEETRYTIPLQFVTSYVTRDFIPIYQLTRLIYRTTKVNKHGLCAVPPFTIVRSSVPERPCCSAQALILDSTLAWRFYVLYGHPRWALWTSMTAVTSNASENDSFFSA